MNLHGMDTVSVISAALANRALAAGANRLITTFDYREGRVRLQGTFGPWQIVPGGSGRLLRVDLPIKTGTANGLRGQRTKSLGGLTVRVDLSLRLIPAPTGGGVHDLCFDIEGSGGSGGAALPLTVIDPEEILTPVERSALASAMGACLSAHAADISFVFAQVGRAGAGPLSMPNHDWRYVETGDGTGYLAIAGALGAISGDEDFDPELLKGEAQAVFALSYRAFYERILLPYLQSSFRPKAGFKLSGAKIVSTSSIRLPEQTSGVWWVKPTITGLSFVLKKGALEVTAVTRSEMPLWTTFDCTVVSTLPFVLNAKHDMRFQPDPKPKVTYSVGLPPVLDTLIGWFVNWIVGFFDAPIKAMVSGIATGMQSMNSRAGQPVSWTGIRDFETDAAELSATCFRTADLRPA